MNLGIYVTRTARRYPDRIATADANGRKSYRQFDERSNRLAQGLLSLGLRPGDRVAVQAWNRSEIVELEVACYKAGLVKTPVNARLAPAEVLHVLNNAEPTAMIAGPEHAASLATIQPQVPGLKHMIHMGPPPEGGIGYEALLAESSPEFPDIDVDPDEVAVLHYSSGTTGKLKAIMQTFGNRLAMLRKALMRTGEGFSPQTVLVHVGPITHASGMFLMPTLYAGGSNVILGRFDVEELLATIEKEKATHVMMVPTMINIILNHPAARNYDLSSLKALMYGASPMSPTRIKEAIDFFGPILTQGYGMGESTSMTTSLTAEDHLEAISNGNERRLTSCGRPVYDTIVRVVNDDFRDVAPGEVGEIVIQGQDVMKGYYKEPELTAETLKDGWLHTRDMATVDEQGFIYLVDRKSDMIISGGFNVYPTEVEQVLFAHPDVFEACVFGVPDDNWGEAVMAACVLKDGAECCADDIIEHCGASLAGFKKPRYVEIVDELPKNPNGKVVRRKAAEKYWAGKDRRVN